MNSILTNFLFSQGMEWIARAGKALRKAKKLAMAKDAELEALRAENAALRARAEAAERKLQELQDEDPAKNEGGDTHSYGSSKSR